MPDTNLGETINGLRDRAPDLNPLFRTAILKATYQPFISRNVRQHGMKLGASRFVAGETWEECVPVLQRLNSAGLRANTTLLGEAVQDTEKATWVVNEYLKILDGIAAENLDCNVALKLTHLGLDLGEEIAYANVETLVKHAATLDNFIRIDMEESARVDATLRIYEGLRQAGHTNTGTVLQSCLYRTGDDLNRLLPLAPNLRLVKGAYLEPPDFAYPKKTDVDRRFLELVEQMLRETPFVAVATHDQQIIDHVIAFASEQGMGRERFEFQMLYGIRSQYQQELAAQGYGVRVATPHGPEWYYYLMRRLAERPANLAFVVKNLIG